MLPLIRGQLLSQHYLSTQLVNRDDWNEVQTDERAARIEKLFEQVKPQLSKNTPASKGSNEDAVRDLFLNRVFDVLGIPWSLRSKPEPKGSLKSKSALSSWKGK